MLLRIDPCLSVLWRTPMDVQIGAPTAVAKTRLETAWDFRVFELLRLGIDADRLQQLAARFTRPEPARSLQRMLEDLAPSFDAQSRRSPTLPTVAFRGASDLVALLSAHLDGFGVVRAARPDLTVIVNHFVVPCRHYQDLLSADQRHVSVTCGDGEIALSPVVTPGHTPCLFCLELHRRDRDPEWPTLATQLVRRRAAVGTSVGMATASVELLRILDEWARTGEPRSESTELTGLERETESVRPHPDCGCQALPETARADDGHDRRSTSN